MALTSSSVSKSMVFISSDTNHLLPFITISEGGLWVVPESELHTCTTIITQSIKKIYILLEHASNHITAQTFFLPHCASLPPIFHQPRLNPTFHIYTWFPQWDTKSNVCYKRIFKVPDLVSFLHILSFLSFFTIFANFINQVTIIKKTTTTNQ